MIDTLLEAVALKRLARAGWGRVGVEQAETVASHTWGVAWLVLNFLPADLCREKALRYAILHDLPEVRTGDVTPHDGVSHQTKHEREERAMVALCEGLPRGAELLATWQQYERQSDAESQFVRQLDRLDMAIQAVAYAHEADCSEFIESAASVVTHPVLVSLLEQLRARHSSMQDSSLERTSSG